MTQGTPRVSVVMPTYNRAFTLSVALRSLEVQTCGREKFEVIVVDDGSSDDTQKVLDAIKRSGTLPLVVVRGDHAGPGASRNLGAEAARGEILAFFEDDVTADARWIENALKYFDDPAVDGVEGRTVTQGSGGDVRSFDEEKFLSFIPCNLFLRKNVFIESGGYDARFWSAAYQNYFREDIDLGFTLLERGRRVKKKSDVVVAHPRQFTSWRDAFRHVRRYYFDALLYRKHPSSYRPGIEVKRFGALRIRRPFHYLCMFYLTSILIILFSTVTGWNAIISVAIPVLLVLLSGIGYRYRSVFAANVLSATMIVALPFYYYYWLARGCFAFRSWAVLV